MIDAWDKGPRDRTKAHCHVNESADWINRIGPQVVIEARDLGVFYGELVVGGGEDPYRIALGVTGVSDAEQGITPEKEGCLRELEKRGRKAAASILEHLKEVI